MLPIHEAPKDGTPVILYNKKWNVFPLAQWKVSDVIVPTEQDVDVNLTGWFFDEILCLGEEEGFLGWESDYENGDMPTHFMYADPTFYANTIERLNKEINYLERELDLLTDTLSSPDLRFKDLS